MEPAAKGGSRAPSAKVAAKRRAAALKTKQAKSKAAAVEAASRKSGGYGKAVVSCWDVPAGGLKNSPAYRKVVARCGGNTLPSPEKRAGAPLKGGYPVAKWPPNTVVDVLRAFWLPDDWGQAIKNTGPGGTYIGWIAPWGKFFYHRGYFPDSIEKTLGREFTALDGFNGTLRSVKAMVTPASEKKFLRECLTSQERKHVLPASRFHFAVVSARRASSLEGTGDVMLVEAFFRAVGVTPTWYVDAESLADYKRLGLDAVVGGKLTPARNMALDAAQKKGLVCVQVSDDISKWQYYDIERQDMRGETVFTKANAAALGAKIHNISPLCAAQFILAKMRTSPQQPKLGGVFPTKNTSLSVGQLELQFQHFILGDFFVADASPCRFDDTMTLKEDYDFSCTHIDRHGCVLRCNRMFVHAKHVSNSGGAVTTRGDGFSKEHANIAILQKKWPGVFRLNKNRKQDTSEVTMRWGNSEAAVRVEARLAKSASAPSSRGILKRPAAVVDCARLAKLQRL